MITNDLISDFNKCIEMFKTSIQPQHWTGTQEAILQAMLKVKEQLEEPEVRGNGEYEPFCPFGYDNCVCDPAYIETYCFDWGKDLGFDSLKESCLNFYKEYSHTGCPHFDDEDK